MPSLFSRIFSFRRPGTAEARAIKDRKPTDDPVRLMRIGGSMFSAGVSYNTTISAHAAMMHPVVHRCMTKIASSFQTIDWYVEKSVERDAQTVVRINRSESHKAFADVLENPNNGMSGAELRYWMALSLAGPGVIYFMVSRDTRGNLNGIYPLPFERINPVVDDNGVVTGYRYLPNGTEQLYGNRISAEKKDDPGKGRFDPYIERIIRPGLTIDHNGISTNSPLQSLPIPAQIIEQLLRRAVETASGLPNSRYVVMTENVATVPQQDAMIEALEKRETGGDESGRILMLSGINAKIEKLDDDLSNIHSKMPLDDMTRMIAGGFGIPIALLGLGAADGAKFASNFAESRTAFWEDTVLPDYAMPIATGLTRSLAPPGLVCRMRVDSVPAMEMAKASRMVTLVPVDFITDDEKRKLCGMPPLTAEQKAELAARRTTVPPPSIADKVPIEASV